MKVIKIYFQKNYPVAEFQYEHYGVEVIVDESQDIDKAFDEAREITRLQWLKNAHPFEDNIRVVEPVKEIQKEVAAESISLEDQIKSVTELKVLESYRLIVKVNPDLQKVYDKKLKQLSE